MKIFLTEYEEQGKVYAGPNIVAKNLEAAQVAAEVNNLTVVGEFSEIYVDEGLMHFYNCLLYTSDAADE